MSNKPTPQQEQKEKEHKRSTPEQMQPDLNDFWATHHWTTTQESTITSSLQKNKTPDPSSPPDLDSTPKMVDAKLQSNGTQAPTKSKTAENSTFTDSHTETKTESKHEAKTGDKPKLKIKIERSPKPKITLLYGARFLTFSAVDIEVFFLWFTFMGVRKAFFKLTDSKNDEVIFTAFLIALGNYFSDIFSVNATEETEDLLGEKAKATSWFAWLNTWFAAFPINALLTSSDIVGIADMFGSSSPYLFVPLSIWTEGAGVTYYGMLSGGSMNKFSQRTADSAYKLWRRVWHKEGELSLPDRGYAFTEASVQILCNDIYRATLGVITLSELPSALKTVFPSTPVPEQSTMVPYYIVTFILGFYVAHMQRSVKVIDRFYKDDHKYIDKGANSTDLADADKTLTYEDYLPDAFFTTIRGGAVAYLSNRLMSSSPLSPGLSVLFAGLLGLATAALSMKGRKDLLRHDAALKLPAVKRRKEKAEETKKAEDKAKAKADAKKAAEDAGQPWEDYDELVTAAQSFNEVSAALAGSSFLHYTTIGINLVARSARVLSFLGFLAALQTLIYGEGEEPLAFEDLIAVSLLFGTAVAEADGPNFYNNILDFLTYLYTKIYIVKSASSLPGLDGSWKLIKRFFYYYFTPKSRLDFGEVLHARIQQLTAELDTETKAADKAIAEAFKLYKGEEVISIDILTQVVAQGAPAHIDPSQIPLETMQAGLAKINEKAKKLTLAEYSVMIRRTAENMSDAEIDHHDPAMLPRMAAIAAIKKQLKVQEKLEQAKQVYADIQAEAAKSPLKPTEPGCWTKMKARFGCAGSKSKVSDEGTPFTAFSDDPADDDSDDLESKSHSSQAAGAQGGCSSRIMARFSSSRASSTANQNSSQQQTTSSSFDSNPFAQNAGLHQPLLSTTADSDNAGEDTGERKHITPPPQQQSSRWGAGWWPFGRSSASTEAAAPQQQRQPGCLDRVFSRRTAGPTDTTPLLSNANDVNSRRRGQSGAVDEAHLPPPSDADDYSGTDTHGRERQETVSI